MSALPPLKIIGTLRTESGEAAFVQVGGTLHVVKLSGREVVIGSLPVASIGTSIMRAVKLGTGHKSVEFLVMRALHAPTQRASILPDIPKVWGGRARALAASVPFLVGRAGYSAHERLSVMAAAARLSA